MMECQRILLTLIFITIAGFSFTQSLEAKIRYGDHDLEALNKFKVKSQDILSSTSKYDYFNSNEYLIKWIQDQKYDLVKAEEKFRKSVQWRKEHNVDNIGNDPIVQSLNRNLPFYDLGLDNEGRPSFGLSVGVWNIRRFALAGKLDLIQKQFIHMFERALGRIKNSWKQDQRVTQFNFLTNYAGFNTREQFCLRCIPIYPQLIIMFQNNYPIHAKRIVVINAPRLFENLLQVIRPVINPETQKALKVFSVNRAEWQKYLHSFLDPRSLTLEYGGLKNKHIKNNWKIKPKNETDLLH